MYNTLATPSSELGKFGIGIGLYFTTLQIIGIIALFAGIINIPLISYYDSSDYRGDTGKPSNLLLAGSAICTNSSWVACTGCSENFNDKDKKLNSYAETLGESDVDPITFVKKNWCEFPPLEYAIIPFVSLCFVFVAFIKLGRFLACKINVIETFNQQD